jgi:hypothetical protein
MLIGTAPCSLHPTLKPELTQEADSRPFRPMRLTRDSANDPNLLPPRASPPAASEGNRREAMGLKFAPRPSEPGQRNHGRGATLRPLYFNNQGKIQMQGTIKHWKQDAGYRFMPSHLWCGTCRKLRLKYKRSPKPSADVPAVKGEARLVRPNGPLSKARPRPGARRKSRGQLSSRTPDGLGWYA